jgi:hypothetical protein
VGQERIWSDAVTNRVFVLEGRGVDKARAYRIYRTTPAPEPPPPPDPDRNTADTAEQEGVTEARWNSSGSGYGARVLLARGYATVVPAPAFGVNTPTAPVTRAFAPYCGFVDRDLYLGRVAKAEYDTGSTSAAAVAAAVDDNTRQDLNQPERCNMGQLGQALSWPYQAAGCNTSTGDGARTGVGDDRGGRRLGSSSVHCPTPGGTLAARAETTLEGGLDPRLTGVVDVQRAWTETNVEKLPRGGVRSTTTAVAEGITIGGTLRIGQVRATATSFSDGRPRRGAMSSHDIAVSHVSLGGTALCDVGCDPVWLEQRLNTAAGSRAVFRTANGTASGRDHGLLVGSPKGAQTAVQKSVARQASDRALVGDFTNEVPAFEMTVFNDSPPSAEGQAPNGWGRARQIYQFAGVTSSATYNIVRLPSFSDLPLLEEPASEALEASDLVGLAFAEGGGSGGSGPGPFTGAAASTGRDRPTGWTAPFVAVARGLRVLLADPRRAVLLLAVWALLGLPSVLARRRRLLGATD